MSENVSRRSFLKKGAVVSAGASLAFGLEEKALLAGPAGRDAGAARTGKTLPTGKIGDLEITRLICGGNLISGFAHSRDLIYVSPLVKKYFTDEKICETLRLCEENGVNTGILRVDEHTIRVLKRYWGEWGGRMQWVAQVKPKPDDLEWDTKLAADNGAVGCYVQGATADTFVADGRVDLLGKCLEIIRRHKMIAGLGAHELKTTRACVDAGLEPDFHMKTLNAKNYWSAAPMPRHDSVWAETPQETIEFMSKIDKPWIAFKVLGAGAIHPKDGFRYAFENGADFACVGMFDFQVVEDVIIARNTLSKISDRSRPWMA